MSVPQVSHISSGSGSGIKQEGGGSGSGSGVSIKRENATSHRVATSTSIPDSNDLYVTRTIEDAGYVSSDLDEHEQGPRQDVDYINGIIDLTAEDSTNVDGEDPSSSRAATHRFNSPAQAPIRINRYEHRDRAPPVNPEAGDIRIKQQPEEDLMDVDEPISTVKKGKQKAGEVQLIGSSRRWRGVYEDEPEFVLVKEEPADDAVEPPSAVGRSGRAKTEESKPKRNYRANKVPPAHLQTEEERAEFYRHDHDLQLLVEELSHIGPTPEAIPAEAASGAGQPAPDQKEDRVYLFQLPPVVPNLTVLAPIVIKDEPAEGPQTAAEAGRQQAPSALSNAALDGPPVPIKIEDDRAETKRPKHLPSLTSGLAGKLRVHKSGKVTLNWGGTSLQVSKGMDSGFLQDILMVRRSAEGQGVTDGGQAAGGDALAFGQLRGKFVVTPDWDEVLG
jgi:DNA-directed RNA polymerase III subunit RPC4